MSALTCMQRTVAAACFCACLLASNRSAWVSWQVRGYPCNCQWAEHCDSQHSSLPPTRMAQKAQHTQPVSPLGSSQSHDDLSVAPDGHPHNVAATQQPTDATPSGSAAKQADTDCSLHKPVDLPQQISPLLGPGVGESSSGSCTDASGRTAGEAEIGQGRQGRDAPAADADLERLEQEFVHDVYNAIAPHFSATRFAIWPKVSVPFCASAQPSSMRMFTAA